MMFLHLLLHVLIYQLLSARGGKKDCPKSEKVVKRAVVHIPSPVKSGNFIVKHAKHCPRQGFYFSREPSPNGLDPGPCYLCYCQEDDKVICWEREDSVCLDAAPGIENGDALFLPGLDENDTKVRRSRGISGLLNHSTSKKGLKPKKLHGTKCKPHQASVIDDCRPEKWCRGCTVCECGPRGRWQCNILKYCRDKSKGSERKKRRKQVLRMQTLTESTADPEHASKRNKIPIKRSGRNSSKSKKHLVKTTVPTDKSDKKQSKYQVILNKSFNNNASKMIIMKNIATHKPIQLKGNKTKKIYKNDRNSTHQAKAKEVLASMKKKSNTEFPNITEIIDYRQMRFPRVENITLLAHNNGNFVDSLKPLENRLTKRQLKIPPIINFDPSSWRRRYRRSVSPVEMTTTAGSLVATEETFKETESVELITQTLPSNTVAESFTVIPFSHAFHRKHKQEDYYKYDVATEQTSGLTPLEKNVDINVNLVELPTTDYKATHPPKDASISSIRLEKDDAGNSTKSNLTYLPGQYAPNAGINIKSDDYNPIRTFKYFTRAHLDANEFKNPKWPQLNIFKPMKLPVERTMNIGKLEANKSFNLDHNKVLLKEIGRVNVAKKYNLIKILNHPRQMYSSAKIDGSSSSAIPDGSGNMNTMSDAGDVRDILGKILNDSNTSMLIRSKKTKKLNVIKYWKKILNKMITHDDTPERINRSHVIQTLCENFGPCNLNHKGNDLLQTKIVKLDQETDNIIRLVRITKGLLRLLGNQEAVSENATQEYFRNDIQRLHSVLKGTYASKFNKELTEDQVLQIQYIKKNTQDFVKSVSKFTILLDELIRLLTKRENVTNVAFENDTFGKQIVRNNSVQNIRALLSKYKLVQNNFMKKVLDFLNKVEARNSTTGKEGNVVKIEKSTENSNSTQEIENFAKNIIRNIRKLKHLAQSLNITSSKARLKRETDSEDAMEYLLSFMEYILKKNQAQLDTAPVNDGLDLLIEAIKNAPDIKTITKKVLPNNAPSISFHKNNETVSVADRRVKAESSDDDNSSSIDKVLNEDSSKHNTETEDEILELVDQNHKDFIALDTLNTVSSSRVHSEYPANRKFQSFTRNLPITEFPDIEDRLLQNTFLIFDVTTPLQSDIEKQSPFSFKEENNDSETLKLGTTSNNYGSYEHIDTKYKLNDHIEDNTSGERSRNKARKTMNFNHSQDDIDDNISNLDGKNKNNTSTVNDYTVSSFDDLIDKNGNTKVIMSGMFNDSAEKANSFDDGPASSKNNNDDSSDTIDNAKEIKHQQNTTQTEDLEEDVFGQNISTSTTAAPVTSTTSMKPRRKVKTIKFKSLDSDNEVIDQKSKLEWIVENFGTEEKSIVEDKDHEEKREDVETKPTIKVNTEASNYISIEFGEKTTKKDAKQDDVLLTKQMNLMNYLDYGPSEKPETDEGDSKSVGNADDKYAETFSSYFV